MSNNKIVNYSSNEFGNVRSIIIDEEVWFVGKDVADSLGYSNTRDALLRHVYDEDKADVVIHDGSQNRKMKMINESGLYSLIMSSKLESAKNFKRWITSEVLPAIRKTGSYGTDNNINTRKLSALNTSTKIIMNTLSEIGASDKVKIDVLKEVYSKVGIDIHIDTNYLEDAKTKQIKALKQEYNELEALYREDGIKSIQDDMKMLKDMNVSDRSKEIVAKMLYCVKNDINVKFN